MVMSAAWVPTVFFWSWVVPVPGGLAASLWYGFWHIGFKLADTLFLIPFEAWGGAMTPDYRDRTTLWAVGDCSNSFGILLGIAVPSFLACSPGDTTGCAPQWVLTLLLSVAFIVATLNLFWRGREAPYEAITEPVCRTLHVKRVSGSSDGGDAAKANEATSTDLSRWTEQDTISVLISTMINKPFRLLLIAQMVRGLGREVPFAVLPFLTKYVVGENCMTSGTLFGLGSIAMLGTQLLTAPLWALLARRIGKISAWFAFSAVLAVSSLAFVFVVQYDEGCLWTLLVLPACVFWGLGYGGSFLLKDLTADIVDYDEFLSGGRRREGFYFMSSEFLPKFMTIPGECLPFVAMSFLGYARAPRLKVPCNSAGLGLAGFTDSMGVDERCDLLFRSEGPNDLFCVQEKRCTDLIANGVGFVCSRALGDDGDGGMCAFKQNEGVRWTLVLCMSVIPAVFIFISSVSMMWYPKEGRTATGHEKLRDALDQLRRGSGAVEDPWSPGNWVRPSTMQTVVEEDLRYLGLLSYLWPEELQVASSSSDSIANWDAVTQSCLKRTALYSVVLVVGFVVVIIGLPDMTSAEGASVTPIGFAFVGVGVVGAWFNGTRMLAAKQLREAKVTTAAVLRRLQTVSPFLGKGKAE